MARYPVNFPVDLKRRAETLAKEQGVSLNQFILWAVSEKVGALGQKLDDNAFPHVTYRRSATGAVAPVVRGTNIPVQTIVVEHKYWGRSAAEIAKEHWLSKREVEDALAFYEKHADTIDAAIDIEAKKSVELYAKMADPQPVAGD